MITVKLNEANFEYDIYSLIKAFYPQEEILVDTNPKADQEKVSFSFAVTYAMEQITITWKIKDAETTRRCDVCYQDRKDTKNRLKRLLYEILQEISGRELPWGTLTGIRPTKIPLRMLEEGADETAIRTYMKDTYLISEKKETLCTEIAKKEHRLLAPVDYENGYSLYIGIPFCPSTCLYCSFTSYPIGIWKKRVDAYLEALFKEIDFVAEHFKDKVLDTIYIGGGTPTSLSADQLDRLLTKIEESLDLSDLLEFTVEAGRPDSITRDKLEALHRHGIGRISINPQTMNQKTLDLIGRHHTVEQVIDSFHLAREVGFATINMDLIVGLPGEHMEDVEHTMSVIKELDPDNLTVHSLAIKRSARLNLEWDKYQDLHMENSEKHMALAHRTAQALGMEPYYLYRQKNMTGNLENIGFAKEGKAGLYNILIMEEKQSIVALGAGAACKCVSDHGLTVTRCENVKDVGLYIERIDEMIERKRELFSER